MSHGRLTATLLLLSVLYPAGVKGADRDSVKTKDGWSLNPLPALGYDSDFGFMAGAFVDLNYYGGLYPNYRHRLCFEALVYSKHASYYMLKYDSRYLIPGVRTQAKIFFDNNPLYTFYGFNGSVHEYDSNLNLNRSDGIAYYSFDRKFLNARLEFEGNLSSHISWTAGLSYWHYWIKSLHWKGYNPDYTLFGEYLQSGLIDENEANGGRVSELTAGIKYDTRDIEASPSSGIYADLNAVYSPDLFRTGYDYLKLAARFRQYLSLGTERVVFAYSLAYQGTFAGNPAFYSQPSLLYFKPSDGLGGATTLRGVLYNRVVGSDYLWGNFELRTRILDINLLNRRIFAVATPFFDAGIITQPFRFERQAQVMYNADNKSGQSFTDYRSSLLEKARELHMSCGISAQLVVDYNFIPTIVFGIPFDKRDGDYGLYMTLDYIF